MSKRRFLAVLLSVIVLMIQGAVCAFAQENEALHIVSYREEGYEIVYVSTEGAGNKDGSSAENAYEGFLNATAAKTGTDKKVAFVLVDTFAWNGWGHLGINGGNVIITSIDGKNGDAYFNITNGSPNLCASDFDAHVIFDNIKIMNSTTSKEPAIHAKGNDITLTENVLVETKTSYRLIIRANADTTSTVSANRITIETPSLIHLHACGHSKTSTINGDLEFVVGKNANIDTLNAGGKGATTYTNLIDGDVYVNVKDNAKVKTLRISDASPKIDGNLYINISDKASITSTISFLTGTVTGNAVIRLDGGSAAKVESNAEKVLGKTILIVDKNNASVPSTVTNVPYIVTFEGNGDVAYNEAGDMLTLTPNDNVKYIRVTNGENVKEYNINGDEVTLAGELFVDLAEGTTAVEFLNDGTETKKVTFVSDGETVSEALVPVGIVPTIPTITKEGYTLSWDKEVVAVTESVTYTAVWTEIPKATVTYVNEKGDAPEAVTDYVGTSITVANAPEAVEHFTFEGWSDGETTYNAGDTFVLGENGKTFIAVWKENAKAMVSYTNTKGDAPESAAYYVGSTITVENAPEEVDFFIFEGWSDGEAIYKAGDTFVLGEDGKTLTAVWADKEPEVVTHTVTIKLTRETGSKAVSFAKMYIYTEDSKEVLVNTIALEDQNSNTGEITADITLLEGVYYAEIVKNGYLTFKTEITISKRAISINNIKLIPGDIKDSYESECGDGNINIDDFVRVLRGFPVGTSPELTNAVDINEDGYVNVIDLGYIKANFGKSVD